MTEFFWKGSGENEVGSVLPKRRVAVSQNLGDVFGKSFRNKQPVGSIWKVGLPLV